MLRNPVREFSLSRAGKGSSPRPSFRPAVEALEARDVPAAPMDFSSPLSSQMFNVAYQMTLETDVMFRAHAGEAAGKGQLRHQQNLEQQAAALEKLAINQGTNSDPAFAAARDLFHTMDEIFSQVNNRLKHHIEPTAGPLILQYQGKVHQFIEETGHPLMLPPGVVNPQDLQGPSSNVTSGASGASSSGGWTVIDLGPVAG
jgi:hypothetical protein